MISLCIEHENQATGIGGGQKHTWDTSAMLCNIIDLAAIAISHKSKAILPTSANANMNQSLSQSFSQFEDLNVINDDDIILKDVLSLCDSLIEIAMNECINSHLCQLLSEVSLFDDVFLLD